MEPESRKKYIDEEKESVASYMDDQLSHSIGRTSLQLDTSKKIDRLESLYSGILVDIRESSDPSRLILEIIQNPIIPLCKKGDNVVTIADYQIYLLEQLMRISPIIKPCVREEALKLALDMKANMKENTENSLAIAVELFGTLGFANKASDFVEKNLMSSVLRKPTPLKSRIRPKIKKLLVCKLFYSAFWIATYNLRICLRTRFDIAFLS
ncbi:hypothetical protein QL285_035017 [Trifolium repens]|nr:hypothetical protein QL285_035017 [Trifolium repens]